MIQITEALLAQNINDASFFLDEPMKNHTTFKIGGPATALIIPKTIDSILQTLSFCKQNNIDYFVLGNGSNIIFSDKGFHGIVLKIAQDFDKISIDKNLVTAQAGAKLTQVSRESLFVGNLTGFEFAGGIPGNIGGAVYMNAGAYEQSISSVLKSVTYIDTNLEIITKNILPEDMQYRNSIFAKNNYIILEATFELINQNNLEKINCSKTMFDQYNAQRKAKQPLEWPSAGSTFKRPENNYASKLIQDAGLKGLTVGGAQVSQKHSGFIININNATANDVLALVELVKQKVFNYSGILLELENKLVGFKK